MGTLFLRLQHLCGLMSVLEPKEMDSMIVSAYQVPLSLHLLAVMENVSSVLPSSLSGYSFIVQSVVPSLIHIIISPSTNY